MKEKGNDLLSLNGDELSVDSNTSEQVPLSINYEPSSVMVKNSVSDKQSENITVACRGNGPEKDAAAFFSRLKQRAENGNENNTQDDEVKLSKEADYNSSDVSSVSSPFTESPTQGLSHSKTHQDEACLDFKASDETENLPFHKSCCTESNSCSKQHSFSARSENIMNRADTHSGRESTLSDNTVAKDATLFGNLAFLNLNENQTAPECKTILKAREINDPFDLFSDDDTKPKRYQPIKRKWSRTMSASDQNGNHSNLEPVENILPLTVEMVDCKKMKLAGRVAYVHSEELLQRVNQLTRIEGRADLVHSLVQAYGLFQYIDVIPPRAATEAEILGFHSSDYIDFLRNVSTVSDVEENNEGPRNHYTEAEAYGLSYDCPLQDGIFETASLISGASIVAANTLISEQTGIAINWYGGWHHAKRDSASGFCYINDIVLAILKLREKYDKVLYVDIDLHHGDGVEEAFSLTSKVMTVSFHKYASGFFPGSGALNNVGLSRGKFYAVNIPLQDGIKDAEFCSIFCWVMKTVKEKFLPEAVVLQCGADGLSEDQMASFNLTHIGLAKCVCFVLAWNLPTLLLGGGGYNFASTSKCWTFLTALVARRKLPLEIPEHENLLAYGPDYQMTTTVGNRRDCNSKQYLRNLMAKISRNLENI